MHITIEANIPVPVARNGSSGLALAVKSLKVGDSFLMPIASRNYLYKLANTNGFTILSRTVEKGTIRVWRTA